MVVGYDEAGKVLEIVLEEDVDRRFPDKEIHPCAARRGDLGRSVCGKTDLPAPSTD
jgi:hypothetical protein